MNPGAVVAGGGGSAGGGSGGSGKDGNGNGGAGSGEGGNGPDEGNQSADGCGAGANGGCTNCGSQMSRGDPFDVMTGEVYTIPKQDLYLPGPFGLRLLRKYVSSRREHDAGMGFGWVHTLGWSLTREHGMLVVRTGDGRVVELPEISEATGEYWQGRWNVVKTPHFYGIAPGHEFVHLFAQLEGEDGPFFLTHVLYRKRGCLYLEYERGQLRQVTDSVGRVVRFESTPEGRIASITVPAPTGETLTCARFEYDSLGDLVAATDADGATTRYAYDEDHRLRRLAYPNGLTFHFVYDKAGRCIETWGEREDGADPALDEALPQVLADGQTRAKGIYHCVADYLNDDYVEVVDSVRLQRFFRGPGGKIKKAVGARGQVTDRTFDDAGNVTSQTDPLGHTWSWDHDEYGRVIRETSPEGHVVEFSYDREGRVIGITDPAGGKTELERDQWGEINWVKNQLGAFRLFTNDERGLMVHLVDERSAEHRFEYDAHGNCVLRQLPNGARYEFRYDPFGRMVGLLSPSGDETRMAYTPSGRLIESTSPLGRSERLRYDGMGNLVAEVAPDGSATYFDYGGLNWLYRVTHPDGNQIQIRHNREGWITHFENERGERHTFSHELDGHVAETRDFVGICHRFTYDEMGRIVALDRGLGKHEFEYSPTGQLLAHLGPEGGAQRFSYNVRGELLDATSDGVSLSFAHDPTGEIIAEELRFDGSSYTIESERDLGGARLERKDSLGHRMQARREPTGKVAELWVDGKPALRFVRDPEGRPLRREFPEGGAITQTWDRDGRPIRQEVVPLGQAASESAEPEWVGERRSGIFRRDIEYTAVNEVARISTSDGTFVEYEYDARRHLCSAKSNTGRVEQFRVDPSSNYQDESPGAAERIFGRGSKLESSGNWEYVHDPNGRLVGKRARLRDGGHGKWWRYTYDDFGMLRSVHRPDGLRVEFEYDAYARRVKKAVYQDDKLVRRVHFVWDLVTLLHEITYEGEGATPRVRSYLYEDNDDPVPLGHRDGGPEAPLIHYLTDVNGYPLELVDGRGNIVARMEHTAFGEPILPPGQSAPTPFRFAGQYADEETGLFYNRYRYYDPELGRFITPDPIGIQGGLNLYAYAPNPVGWIDPMGWKHYARQDDGTLLASGWSTTSPERKGAKDCPEGLQTQAKSHTEQQWAQGLIDEMKGKTEAQQAALRKDRELTGDWPPCPNCHGAMMRAAQETGQKLTYDWGTPPNTQAIVYDGTSVPSGGQLAVTARKGDAEAEALVGDGAGRKGAYDGIKLDDKTENFTGGKDVGVDEYWGIKKAGGENDAYEEAKKNGGYVPLPHPDKR